jgi:hypothetical protein
VGIPLELTPKEALLLEQLLRARGAGCRKSELLPACGDGSRVVGWKLDYRMDASVVIDAPNRALGLRRVEPETLLLHSDQGNQPGLPTSATC